jgi:anti-sigma regulatory factor (Ser/Thr protein kinase)
MVASRIVLPVENAGEARYLVRSRLGDASAETLEIAELLVSELVSNAILHGEGIPMLIAEVKDGSLHVEVFDSEPTLTLSPLPLDRSRERGRGLAIVDALATAWGVEGRHEGKAVWFDLVLHRAG